MTTDAKTLLFINNASKCFISIYILNNINSKFTEGETKVTNMYFEEIFKHSRKYINANSNYRFLLYTHQFGQKCNVEKY